MIMLGAIIGDMVGSVYEWENTSSLSFPIPDRKEHVTDDSVMTCAIASALLEGDMSKSSPDNLEKIRKKVIDEMRRWYLLFPDAGYGRSFLSWLKGENGYLPYGSYGNGAGMRISPIGWLATSEENLFALAKCCTDITHDHEEGIKGAEAIALGVFLSLHGCKKEEIRKRLLFFYPELADIDLLLEKGRRQGFDFSCQGTVPLAIAAFLKAKDEEETIRLAVSLGGDSDTIACMAGSLAEAYWQKDSVSGIERLLWPSIPEKIRDVVLLFHGKDRKGKILSEIEPSKKPSGI